MPLVTTTFVIKQVCPHTGSTFYLDFEDKHDDIFKASIYDASRFDRYEFAENKIKEIKEQGIYSVEKIFVN